MNVEHYAAFAMGNAQRVQSNGFKWYQSSGQDMYHTDTGWASSNATFTKTKIPHGNISNYMLTFFHINCPTYTQFWQENIFEKLKTISSMEE